MVVFPKPDSGYSPGLCDSASIRDSLPSEVAAEFDVDWNLVLDRAKQSHDLTGVFELLHKWRFIAQAERAAPGAYFRLLAKAEQITSTGRNPDAAPVEEMQAVIRRRLGR